MPEVPERLGRLEQRMERVEEGVSNFREFQTKASDFFSRADERAINDTAHRNRRDQEIKDALATRDAKLNRRLVIAGIIMSLFMAWITWRDSQRKLGENAPPTVQSFQNPPQVSGSGAPHY